ncbi:MAG: acylphosphatase [Bacteroidia bacterium]
MPTLHLSITGLVQGVFFRKHTQEKAIELGIKGTVRNLNDGSVEVIAQGEQQVLDEFVKWCHVGPARARVDRVVVTVCPSETFDGFQVKKD